MAAPTPRCCLHCRVPARVEPVGRLYGLCKPCLSDRKVRRRYLRAEPPPPARACPHPPGSKAKVEWLRARARRGESVFHPGDAGFEGSKPGCVSPPPWPEVKGLPKLRIRGVERSGQLFVARPMLHGRKTFLGEFPTYDQAAAAARRWWVQELGLFWELGGYMRFFVARDTYLARQLGLFAAVGGARMLGCLRGGGRPVAVEAAPCRQAELPVDEPVPPLRLYAEAG